MDEKPNLQVLERAAATQPRAAGRIERQEFEYLRHGTVNWLVGLTLYNGRMWDECLDKNDGAHFRPAMRRLLHPYGWAKRIYLIMDNGPSHTSDETADFFAQLKPRVQVLLTPSHASWLNQAEILLRAFTQRYLNGGSWGSRMAMTTHLLASRIEYNEWHAHPFSWEWMCRDEAPFAPRRGVYQIGHEKPPESTKASRRSPSSLRATRSRVSGIRASAAAQQPTPS